MSNKQSLTQQSFFLIIGRTLAYLLNMGLPICLVRIFTQSEYGLYKQLFLLFNTLLPLGQLGIAQSLYYFLPRYPEKKNALMTQTFIFILVTSILCGGGLLFFRESIAQAFHNKQMLQYLPLLAFYSFFMISSSFLEISMIAEGNAKLASITFVMSQIVNTSLLLLFAITTQNLLYVMYGAILFSMIRFIIQIVYLLKKYKISLKNIDLLFWKRQFSYSIPIGLGNISWLIQIKLHQYFVSYFFDARMFAIYSIGCFKLPILGIITSSVSNVMVPSISKYQKEGNREQIIQIWKNAVRKMNFFFFPTLIFFFIIANDFIVVLFTSNYSESVSIFRVGLFAILISGLNPGAILQGYAKTRFIMKIAFFRLPVTAIILYSFIKKWGVLGAVTGDVAIMFLFRFILLIKAKKVLKSSLLDLLDIKNNGKIFIIALIAGIPIYYIQTFWDVYPIIRLTTSGLVYLITYCTLSLLFKCVPIYEAQKMWRFIHNSKKIIFTNT